MTCDGCSKFPIVGVRYKCTICNDFDFCEDCEKDVKHEHIFLKIKNPQQIKQKVCFIKNLFCHNKPQQEKKENDGYELLLEEFKETYHLDIKDHVILEALKKNKGDIEKTLDQLFE